MSGKTSTSTSTVAVPQQVLARYNSVNKTAQSAAATPFQSYSSNPDAFVAPLSATQQAGIQNTNAAAGQAQPYYQAGAGLTLAGAGSANPTQIGKDQINQFMSPYVQDVARSESDLLNQNNQQAMAGQLGTAIQSGAFGGDRAGIAAANLNQQQNLANANIYSNILNTGYNSALGAAQQQQGVNLGAQQANLSRLSGAGSQLANLGAGSQSAALQGATAQLSAGQQEQSTQQAGLTSLYNQFLQQQAYPFQTAQFLANIAEGTGSLSGSTTSTTQPTGLFGNLLSDRRAKEDIKKMGKAKNGLNIYSFRYKGDPNKVTHIGFMADEVEKKHPEAVGLAGGLKTVDYERASRAEGGQLMFDPSQGAYGLAAASMPGKGGYIPAPHESSARQIVFQHAPPSPQQTQSGGLSDAVSSYKDLSSIYDTGKGMAVGSPKDDTKGLFGAGGNWNPSAGYLAHGGLAVHRDDGGAVDTLNDQMQDRDLRAKQAGLAAAEKANIQAPDSAAGPVSGALQAQDSSPKYHLNAPATPGNGSSTSSDLKTLASLGSDVASFFLASGGLVPREHHADGSVVGDDIGPTSPEDQRLWTGDLVPAQNRAEPALHDRAPMPASPSPGVAPSSDPIPLPPRRPAGLNPPVSPDDVRAQPDLKLPEEPMLWHGSNYEPQTYHYQPNGDRGDRAMVADARPAQAPSGLAAATAGIPTAKATVGLAASPWRAPTYSGARPEAAPDPASYGVDQAGQAAFIRDYAAYKGIDPKFALGVANAEGLRAINDKNPNGASSVDIDPKTGKPFSFGAFQLNVRNGLGNVAMAKGIDPTNPGHANIANAFALDQMAAGGLKPWRGDAAVTAYQHGQGTSADNSGQSREISPGVNSQTQQPGLMGSLGSFFHGQPDGQTSPNGGMGERALMAVLGGLGAVGSYKGQSPLGAILQGLGAGAHGWMESGKQQADIANQQAHTGLVGAETNSVNVGAARNSVLDNGMVLGPGGRLHYLNKDIAGPGVELYGAKPNASTAPAASSGALPTPPAADNASKPAVAQPQLFGIGYDNDSSSKARNEVLAGPQSSTDLAQSADYQKRVQDAGQTANTDLRYGRQLAQELVHTYEQTGMNAAGSGFSNRAKTVGTLNTIARAMGMGDRAFGDSDKGQVLTDKINTLQAAMREHNVGQHSLGTLEMFKGANATLEQPPEASSEIASQLMADRMAVQDQWKHMEQWKSESPGSTVRGAAKDFTDKNPAEKYMREANEMKQLMLTKGISPYFDKLASGKYSADDIAKSLKKHGFDPGLARYFAANAQ